MHDKWKCNVKGLRVMTANRSVHDYSGHKYLLIQQELFTDQASEPS